MRAVPICRWIAANLIEVPDGGLPVLQGLDLIVTITARGRGEERPHGRLHDRAVRRGHHFTVAHEDDAVPVRLEDERGVLSSYFSRPHLSVDFSIVSHWLEADA